MSNIEILKVSKATVSRLIQQVSGNDDSSSVELKRAFTNLQNGACENIILSLDNSEAQFANSVIEYKKLRINALSRKVTRDEKEIMLTPKEFDILWFLACNRGQVFTKEQIYRAVWDDKYMLDSSNIMAFIRKIRKKIEPNPDSPQYIITIWGIGYKFSDDN